MTALELISTVSLLPFFLNCGAHNYGVLGGLTLEARFVLSFIKHIA